MGEYYIDMQNDYVVVVDEALLLFVERSIKKEIPNNYQYMLSNRISDRLAKDIERLVGFSVKGYKNKITPGRIREHYNKIEKGNGTSGEFKNKDGSSSKTVVLQGKLKDEYYYVIEAVPDSAKRTLCVTTAYINKNDTIAEAGDAISLNPDVQNGLQSNVSSNIIIPREK